MKSQQLLLKHVSLPNLEYKQDSLVLLQQIRELKLLSDAVDNLVQIQQIDKIATATR